MTFEKKAVELERFVAQLPSVNPLRADITRCIRQLMELHGEEVADAEREASQNSKTDPAPPPDGFSPVVTTKGDTVQFVSVSQVRSEGGGYKLESLWHHESGRELLQIAHAAEPRRVEFLLTDLDANSVATDLNLASARSAPKEVQLEFFRTMARR